MAQLTITSSLFKALSNSKRATAKILGVSSLTWHDYFNSTLSTKKLVGECCFRAGYLAAKPKAKESEILSNLELFKAGES